MPFWTWTGIKNGVASTQWPARGPDGQEGVLGMPRWQPERCASDCQSCADACPTAAIHREGDGMGVDYGRCIVCQACVEACPEEAMLPSGDWAFAVRERQDLHWQAALNSPAAKDLQKKVARSLRRSLHIKHVDAGSCNGCESEISALDNPFYNLHRLGIFFTPSPRFADLLLVTGPVTAPMRDPLLATWEAMPEPRMVLAVGTCAVSGAPMDAGYAGGHGLDGVLSVDVWLPGCPPNPAALIHALLLLLERQPQWVEGGHYVD
ncbi:4Fe-4S binding protein [Acidithiobacillus sp. CV18-2]|uniref:4Fe-4S binding protein n=1 Tax=Igneacidithiobacillus copahuensis TaxID=2724909 RepID=A0AAE3CJT1_9PROT|nr:4Fe-4S binding protein [Igneacidithiobacillus copahuensis]MBU2755539.1 4Fe-4S binding protein [Acidithiobacillus sp. CV18-3]MBU2757790.1 4Fe-4S binding protein [Acidithiobacillus sp. BN09-2]MBU2777945.1 4Fe-4S binding protein [Acidithiobacillus sp. CV18-2]MBU2797871.1 4Fe-4S binding protein [Acidithiobacillus sp. VAN18-2]MBU2799283.1 4Fe-4S binding protein [Acidithiobacillus sp. VAN18-4]UTV80658.1 4Fe-4S binding protein [Acidithiobacillus sp. YTS05]